MTKKCSIFFFFISLLELLLSNILWLYIFEIKKNIVGRLTCAYKLVPEQLDFFLKLKTKEEGGEGKETET